MYYSEIKQLSRKFRQRATPEEDKLWQFLRNRKLGGFKFVRQFPVVYDRRGDYLNVYFPDFYCFEAKLAIEVDGKIHLKTVERDNLRDLRLTSLNIEVLRIPNEALENIDSVLSSILKHLQNRGASPSLRKRGGQGGE